VLGCGPRTGTTLAPVGAQTATVGVELSILLRAQSNGRVDFKYDSDLDLAARSLKPTLTPYANGEALFSWTPLASDVGTHQLRFTATINGVSATETVPVMVTSGVDPISFREPVGDGTTLDLARGPCVSVSLLVDDTSATAVQLMPGATWPSGATLDVAGPLAGRVRFCPSAQQIQATTIFPLTLVATDAGGARAEKRYTIVIGTLAATDMGAADMMPTAGCVTTAPTIVHTPHADVTTTDNLHLYAQLSAPVEIAGATLYWSTVAPPDLARPDLPAMNSVDMLLLAGTYANGQFGATIASPVAGSAPGTRADIYYVIAAISGCGGNVSFSPTSGVDHFVITEGP
jgi:hypothetical protein